MKFPISFCLLVLLGCSTRGTETETSLFGEISSMPSIEGHSEYLTSPFVTAGDRIYLIGFQDGSFPDLGWHITGEMGGIWDHPIKLLDGFTATIKLRDSENFLCLNNADKFVNYPMANRHQFIWEKEQLDVDRTQFVPDGVEGMIVEFRIANHSIENKEIVFSISGTTDLRPTWLGERTNLIDSEDEISFDEKLSMMIAKDRNNPWYAAFGSSLKASSPGRADICAPTSKKGLGKVGTLSYALTVPGEKEVIVPFFVAGSYHSEEALRKTVEVLKTQEQELLARKVDRYKKIDSHSRLTIPDKKIEQMFDWLKYDVDWLVRDVPEIGRGLSAGLPDYPWWFGADAAYSLQGALATGNHALARSTILLLDKISRQTNDNGRIIHEVSTNGAVYNKGNVNETAQFITLVKTYYEWTGDRELVAQLFPNLKKGMEWLLKEKDPDGNHYPNGSGMMEIPGLESNLEMIDVVVYTQQALSSGAALARALGENDVAARYQRLADELRIKINKEWWQPDENSFGDFRGTVSQATPILNAALVRCDTLGKKSAVSELMNTQRQMKNYPPHKMLPFVIYHNWVVNTPLETGVADADKALAALRKAKTYENLFGAFVTGIDRTDEPDSVVLKSRKKTFSYTGAVMTIPTGVLAVANANYGNPDEALEYVKKLNRSFSYALPGSMYEVSPDFGMMTQAWNIYGVAVPIVQHFFGIQPRAYEKAIFLSPHLPGEWKEASLENVMVGDNAIDLSIRQKNDHTDYEIHQKNGDWTLLFDLSHAMKVMVNGKPLDLRTIIDSRVKLNGERNVVQVY